MVLPSSGGVIQAAVVLLAEALERAQEMVEMIKGF
jgi:hypothetical protein